MSSPFDVQHVTNTPRNNIQLLKNFLRRVAYQTLVDFVVFHVLFICSLVVQIFTTGRVNVKATPANSASFTQQGIPFGILCCEMARVNAETGVLGTFRNVLATFDKATHFTNSLISLNGSFARFITQPCISQEMVIFPKIRYKASDF